MTRTLRRGRSTTEAPHYAVAALGVLGAASCLLLYGFAVFGPDIGHALGLRPGAIASLAALPSLAVALTALPLAAFVERRGHRAAIAVAGGLGCAVACGAAVLATGAAGLAAALVGAGAAGVAARVVHPALLVDLAVPAVRVGALAGYRAVVAIGAGVLAPGLVWLSSSALGLSWRGALLVLAAAALATVPVASGLRDPGPPAPHGVVDHTRARRRPSGWRPATGETARGLLRAPTVRRLLPAYAIVGAFAAPVPAYLFFFLDDRWHLGPDARGAVFAAAACVTAVALAALGGYGNRLLATGPAALLDVGWRALAACGIAIAVAVAAPLFGVAVMLICAAFACLAVAETALTAALMTIVAPAERAHAAALAAIVAAGLGGIGGALLLGGLADTLGAGGALVTLAVPALIAAAALRAAGTTAADDRGVMIVRLRDEARVLDTLAGGAALPVLSCRDVVVHFGHRRALDHVDFAVDAGGLVAVLGTNGAGKSTLLRALCGLAAPNSGTVRLDGFDVTLLAPERRAALGVAHVAGAASVFDPLTVRESLVLAALARSPTAGRGPAARDLAANALAAFPALAGRAGARVATLSGGERQLLALAQAYVRQPRVLLVDELSAGLDPSAVADALTLVRRLHATGTTVVVVEQSVDVALRLAPRAVFLERGRVHFDGPSAELRGRTDLLRPVLLERMGTTGVRA